MMSIIIMFFEKIVMIYIVLENKQLLLRILRNPTLLYHWRMFKIIIPHANWEKIIKIVTFFLFIFLKQYIYHIIQFQDE